MSGKFLLFYNDFSICSIMVRFTIAICDTLDAVEQISIEEKPIDIHHGGQLTEYYLTEVNPCGTVSNKQRRIPCKLEVLKAENESTPGPRVDEYRD